MDNYETDQKLVTKFKQRFLSALKPRFCWWSRDLDLADLICVAFFILLFLPILPWEEKRKQGNYSFTEHLSVISKEAERELLNADAIKARYEKEIPNEGLRKCVVARNIVLTMVADYAVMDSKIASSPPSSVPIVFLSDSLVTSFINATVGRPNFESVLVEVAKKCQDYPNAYLTVKEVERLRG